MYEPMVADRVVAVKDGKPMKGRVAVAPGFGKVGVTFHRNESPVMYQVSDVFPLYRYRTIQAKPEFAALFGLQEMEVMEPLFIEAK
jgi:hypothetical protein